VDSGSDETGQSGVRRVDWDSGEQCRRNRPESRGTREQQEELPNKLYWEVRVALFGGLFRFFLYFFLENFKSPSQYFHRTFIKIIVFEFKNSKKSKINFFGHYITQSTQKVQKTRSKTV
jgi:hypothetical protein